MWQKLAWIALAGAGGTLSRYALSGLVQNLCGASFPWGTWVVNGLGCFLFGMIWALAEERLLITGEIRFIVLTGFMGAFTTFSTFAFEASQFLRDSEWLLAAIHLIGQNSLGLVCVFLGFTISQII
ncbi:camphor resistance protein CrcB [Nitrosococcus oceani ATCC 19707]|uniref:Fluoride-specific ion channel FluC n=2 Tax=Nitrosococcus oceani TaxID=1229 RepID=FLUC_NITOC|nr:CrcB family protein [Nitrosococcus oceani]Q3J8V3.1 RecName: Full=Fluoride-specific ion channel FluC [Nitrosococcus oceani ATCC 19707]ABA58743.1 camphor resistance protein CrcB [Nitrosococcus oceani ATCC 19707]EDZ66803.1 CrcB-like protein [Nitrosococcus oceani AFC27]KFI18822.1 chromosome condensation protein CrcB [Nitrosococcus oceani C-27]